MKLVIKLSIDISVIQTANSPFWQAAGWVLLVFGLVLLAVSGFTYHRRRRNKPHEGRTGVITRKGGYTDVSQAEFGSKLDVGVENAGVTDASEARFGVGKRSDDKQR